MGEVVLRDRLEAAGIEADVRSAGVSAEEAGNPIDARAASVLSAHGYSVPHREARTVSREDLSADLLLAMTDQHRRALIRTGAEPARTRLWSEYVPDAQERDVADPWYGDRADFEKTLATIEAGAPAIVEAVRASENAGPQD